MNQYTHTWQPLQPADMVRLPHGEVVSAADARVREHGDVWMNDRYVVHRREIGDVVHLSIRRTDRLPVEDWRHKQWIKNQLVGPECEGVELFPAEARKADTANQAHIWCVKDPSFRFPIGFNSGRAVDDQPHPIAPKAVNRQLDIEDIRYGGRVSIQSVLDSVKVAS